MNNRTLRVALGCLAVGGALLSSRAHAAPPDPEFDWYGLGGCTVPVIGMPTDFANLAPYIPAEDHARVIRTGAGDQAGLIFVLIRCPENRLDAERGGFQRDDVTQVMTGVLYQAARPEDLDKAQFYLLASAINWQPFVLSEQRLGLPSDFVAHTTLNVVRDPITGLGTFEASVPGGRAPLAVSGQILAPNPVRDAPQDAVHFFRGPLGLVRVHHDESWALGNEAVGTVVAAPGTLVATWMGATARDAVGVYVWIHDELHVHRYTILE